MVIGERYTGALPVIAATSAGANIPCSTSIQMQVSIRKPMDRARLCQADSRRPVCRFPTIPRRRPPAESGIGPPLPPARFAARFLEECVRPFGDCAQSQSLPPNGQLIENLSQIAREFGRGDCFHSDVRSPIRKVRVVSDFAWIVDRGPWTVVRGSFDVVRGLVRGRHSGRLAAVIAHSCRGRGAGGIGLQARYRPAKHWRVSHNVLHNNGLRSSLSLLAIYAL